MRSEVRKAKRVVIKVGTSVLTSRRGKFSLARVRKITKQVSQIMAGGRQAILVSSGAIACGMEVMRLARRPRELPKLQACAAIGQGKLMRAYESTFSRFGHHTAQVLLTRDGLYDRKRYLNARNTLVSLIGLRVIPVINENDTVATEEIRFGDNDALSALVASLVEADLLVFLSDVDGIYLRDGSRVPEIKSEKEINEFEAGHLFKRQRESTVGGMEAKLYAGRMMLQAGIPAIIADGNGLNILEKIVEGEDVGTLFFPSAKRRAARKNWLAFSTALSGSIEVDEGACRALTKGGRSLLASGIKSVRGNFKAGDAVHLTVSGAGTFANGLSNYSSEEINKIRGKKTKDIESVLGYKYYDEVIHRDNLVILSR